MTAKELTAVSLFAALTVICSQISIPIPFTPVPLNLATFAVSLSGYVLGSGKGALCQLIFLLLGAAGLPVFAGFNGGLGALAGPTGGYIVSYLAVSYANGAIYKGSRYRLSAVFSTAAGLAVCYFFGTMWFVISTGTNWGEALLMCVVPFIPGDIFKAVLAAVIADRLKAKHS